MLGGITFYLLGTLTAGKSGSIFYNRLRLATLGSCLWVRFSSPYVEYVVLRGWVYSFRCYRFTAFADALAFGVVGRLSVRTSVVFSTSFVGSVVSSGCAFSFGFSFSGTIGFSLPGFSEASVAPSLFVLKRGSCGQNLRAIYFGFIQFLVGGVYCLTG